MFMLLPWEIKEFQSNICMQSLQTEGGQTLSQQGHKNSPKDSVNLLNI